MNPKDYTPSPIDTSSVKLPEAMEQLIETLARNVHETWAAGRMAEGWTWGPVRDEAAKHHPCLVPYDALTEAEKDYDRSTATITLKTILKLGWRIESDDPITHTIIDP